MVATQRCKKTNLLKVIDCIVIVSFYAKCNIFNTFLCPKQQRPDIGLLCPCIPRLKFYSSKVK